MQDEESFRVFIGEFQVSDSRFEVQNLGLKIETFEVSETAKVFSCAGAGPFHRGAIYLPKQPNMTVTIWSWGQILLQTSILRHGIMIVMPERDRFLIKTFKSA